jgi:hypothetical protein
MNWFPVVLLSVACCEGGANARDDVLGMPQQPTILQDVGSVICSDAPPGKVNCWISRNDIGALALSVYEDGSNLVGKFRQYSKGDENFSTKSTQIMLPDSKTTAPISIVVVRLVKNTTFADTYDMIYDTTATATAPSVSVPVGFVRFVRGKTGRPSSDAVIRLGSKVVGSTNPCDKPPIDDVGEEELMAVSALSDKGPGPNLDFLPPL